MRVRGGCYASSLTRQTPVIFPHSTDTCPFKQRLSPLTTDPPVTVAGRPPPPPPPRPHTLTHPGEQRGGRTGATDLYRASRAPLSPVCTHCGRPRSVPPLWTSSQCASTWSSSAPRATNPTHTRYAHAAHATERRALITCRVLLTCMVQHTAHFVLRSARGCFKCTGSAPVCTGSMHLVLLTGRCRRRAPYRRSMHLGADSCSHAPRWHRALLEGKADPSAVKQNTGFTPLHFACEGGHLEVWACVRARACVFVHVRRGLAIGLGPFGRSPCTPSDCAAPCTHSDWGV